MNLRPPGYEPDELPTALPRDEMLAYNKTLKLFCQAVLTESLYILNIFTLSAFYTYPIKDCLFLRFCMISGYVLVQKAMP